MVLHINLSGVAIAVPDLLVPVLGEWILLELPDETTNEKNCFYGKVVDIQDLSDNFRGVVIQFLSTQLSEKFELSRAFSGLQTERQSSRSSSASTETKGSVSYYKLVMIFLAFFWLLAITLTLLNLAK